jgi:hypothetical protein
MCHGMLDRFAFSSPESGYRLCAYPFCGGSRIINVSKYDPGPSPEIRPGAISYVAICCFRRSLAE